MSNDAQKALLLTKLLSADERLTILANFTLDRIYEKLSKDDSEEAKYAEKLIAQHRARQKFANQSTKSSEQNEPPQVDRDASV
jgi:hypothetical protein